MRQVTKNIGRRRTNSRRKILFARHEPSIQIKLHQLRLIIEHLFKVWHQPLTIHCVAMKPSAHLIVNPAIEHPTTRQQSGLFRLFIPLLKKKPQHTYLWKFVIGPHSAPDQIHHPSSLRRRLRDQLSLELTFSRLKNVEPLKVFFKLHKTRRRILGRFIRIFLPHSMHPLEHCRETYPPTLILGRKISPARQRF